MAILLLFWLVCTTGTPPTTSAPASAPLTSQPALSAEVRNRVEELIKRLNDREFKRRETAQRELAAMGEDIWPLLIEKIPHASEEVNDRIIAVVGKPRDPAQRVELAARMLSTGDPIRIETAVYMLFVDPGAVCDLFEKRTADAEGILKIVSPPIADQLLIRKRMSEALLKNLPHLREKDADKAADLVRMDSENNWYSATAAVEMAVDALDESSEDDSRPVASQPARDRDRGGVRSGP